MSPLSLLHVLTPPNIFPLKPQGLFEHSEVTSREVDLTWNLQKDPWISEWLLLFLVDAWGLLSEGIVDSQPN